MGKDQASSQKGSAFSLPYNLRFSCGFQRVMVGVFLEGFWEISLFQISLLARKALPGSNSQQEVWSKGCCELGNCALLFKELPCGRSPDDQRSCDCVKSAPKQRPEVETAWGGGFICFQCIGASREERAFGAVGLAKSQPAWRVVPISNTGTPHPNLSSRQVPWTLVVSSASSWARRSPPPKGTSNSPCCWFLWTRLESPS